MPDPAIIVNNISKSYRLGVIGRQTLQDEVRYWWHKVRGRNPLEYMGKIGHPASNIQQPASSIQNPDTFWALKDISFTVQPGEVLGIIGRNGAGKTTLLKILTRITEPTSGTAIINGRVASLLEVGTGFHPELTGRENIYLNGSILGMKKNEITSKFDEIVDFAEIEKFIDTPVKRYSSGMYVRLAFAVAAHLEPEILLVDEVLAVGDVEFQKKAIGKMRDVSKEHGRTVLFVSHNMAAVMNLCTKGILLTNGTLDKLGDINDVVSYYLSKSEKDLNTAIADREDRKGNQAVKIIDLFWMKKDGERADFLISGDPAVLCIKYKAKNYKAKKIRRFRVSVPIIDAQGRIMTILNNKTRGVEFNNLSREGSVFCEIDRLPLTYGEFCMRVNCWVDGDLSDGTFNNLASFHVVAGDYYKSGFLSKYQGIHIQHNWKT